MTIRETTAMVLLYRACLTVGTASDLRYAAYRAEQFVPDLADYAADSYPWRSHRTMAEVIRDEGVST